MSIFVNEREITEAAVAAEVQNHPAPDLETAERAAAEALVVKELLLQEAARRGLTAAPSSLGEGKRETEEDALIRQLLERDVSVPEADAESCRRYYENNLRRFRSPDVYEAAHIFFPADPDDPDAYGAARRKATTTVDRLQDDPGAFAHVARELSACPSGRDGGSLGQFSRGATLPEFETFLDNLEPGQMSPVPVPSRYGFHVVRLDRREAGRQLPFESVHARIAEYLRTASWQRAVAQYIRLLAGQAEIAGIEFGGAETPLVQ
jgi:peptidyl-prolyl cis-trans isomerase C